MTEQWNKKLEETDPDWEKKKKCCENCEVEVHREYENC